MQLSQVISIELFRCLSHSAHKNRLMTTMARYTGSKLQWSAFAAVRIYTQLAYAASILANNETMTIYSEHSWSPLDATAPWFV